MNQLTPEERNHQQFHKLFSEVEDFSRSKFSSRRRLPDHPLSIHGDEPWLAKVEARLGEGAERRAMAFLDVRRLLRHLPPDRAQALLEAASNGHGPKNWPPKLHADILLLRRVAGVAAPRAWRHRPVRPTATSQEKLLGLGMASR